MIDFEKEREKWSKDIKYVHNVIDPSKIGNTKEILDELKIYYDNKFQEMQVNLARRQTIFNKYLLLATVVIALLGFYQIQNTLLEDLGLSDWKITISMFIGLIILGIISRLIYLLFKEQIF